MAEWLRRQTRNLLGKPAQVRILLATLFLHHFSFSFLLRLGLSFHAYFLKKIREKFFFLYSFIYILVFQICIVTSRYMNPLLRSSRNPTDEKRSYQINAFRNTNRPSSPFLMIGEKIDRKLTKAYQSLRQQSSKKQKMYIKNVSNHAQTYRASSNTDGFITIRLKRQKMMSSINHYQSPAQSKENSIVLIDNADVMEYINQVYQNYGIKDPLQANRNLKKQDRFQTTQSKRIKQLECSTQARSLQSARTNKDSTGSIVHISQFNIQQSQISKPPLVKKSNKILITLRPRSNSKGKHYSNEKILQSKVNIQNSAPTIKCKEKELNQQLPRTRYCFACEKPIIEQKISRHQQSCLLLKLAYTYSYEKISNILNQKIARLTCEVQREIIDVDSKQVFRQFQGLKQKTEQMILQISKNRICEDKQTIKEQQSNWKDKYYEAKTNIDVNFSQRFTLLSKLGWFVSLRNNLSNYRKMNMV